jgi:phosphoenolpyruvate synthase/pyruvate phosphate dikinase
MTSSRREGQLGQEIVPLAELRHGDTARAGGKAAALGDLLAAGFAVPPGVCLTTEGFGLALGERRGRIAAVLGDFDLRLPDQAGRAAEAIAAILADLSVPESLATSLRDALPGLGADGARLAVRSSATAEDRGDASFAGQYDTVVGVSGLDETLAAVVACWRSFFTANALVARAQAGAATGDEAMAVLVQKCVDAECAGVAFSVDPVRGERDVIALEAAWGLCVGVVDGTVATDSYRLSRQRFAIEERRVVEKPERIALAAAGGVERAPVEEARRRASVLPDGWARRVAQVAVAAERHFGSPQDVEWAIADGQLWVLQSRPITTLSAELREVKPYPVEWASDAQRRAFWETRPEEPLSMPLEREVGAMFFESFREANHRKGLERYPTLLEVNGRGYVAGVPTELGEGDRRIRYAAHRDLIVRLRDQGQTTWEHFAPEVIGTTERLRQFDRVGADPAALAGHFEDCFGAFLQHWTIHWLQFLDFGPDPAGEPYRVALGKVSGLEGPALEALGLELADGEETFLTRLVDGLYDLARVARGCSAVAALVADPPPDVAARLAAIPEAAELIARVDALMAVYGERIGSGFGSDASIKTPTWREDLPNVLRMAAPYLDRSIEAPTLARDRAAAARAARLEELCAACSDAEAVADLRRALPFARRQRSLLENHNHYIDQMSLGQLRVALVAVARALVERGALPSVDDVYWLTRAEIVAALRAATASPLSGLVAERRAQSEQWAKLEAPPLLGVPPARLDPRPPFKDEVTAADGAADGPLTGQAASPGRRRGRARIVAMGTVTPAVEPGDVLVAANAGPMWTPVFPILAGVVLDEGALFQHAATIAREYGVPAVIQTVRATKRIKDGDWVVVDGTAGRVEIEPA